MQKNWSSFRKLAAQVDVGQDAAGVPGQSRAPERFSVGVDPALPPGEEAERQQQDAGG